MIKLNYNLNINCKKCNHTIKIKSKNIDFKKEEFERSLGYEIEYTKVNLIKCPKCGNNILLKVQLYEYPKDILNTTLISGNGYFKPELKQHLDKQVNNTVIIEN